MTDLLGTHRQSYVPDLLEPVLGWRAWKLQRNKLRSVYYDNIWTPGKPMIADCHLHPRWVEDEMGQVVKSDKGSPQKGCHCGINAARNVGWATDYAVRSAANIIGTAILWGRITRYDYGYRAEYGYPSHLFLVGKERQAAVLRERYGISCQAIKDHWDAVEIVQESWTKSHQAWIRKELNE